MHRAILPCRSMTSFHNRTKKARVVLREPLENRRHWEGTLAGLENGSLLLETAGRIVRVPLDHVQRANLKFEW